MRYRLQTTLPDSDTARSAVEQLSMRGIDGADIHVGSVPAPADRRTRDRRTDRRSLRRIAGRAVGGGVVGLVAGAGLGAIVSGMSGMVGLTALLLAVMVALACGSLGVIVGLQSIPTMSPAWEEASAGDGPRVLWVTQVPDDRVDEVRSVLRRLGSEPSVSEDEEAGR